MDHHPRLIAALLAAAVAAPLAVGGCDIQHGDPASSCSGKTTLRASGSSAQAIAVDRFIAAYEDHCPGYALDYRSNGSAVGIAEFTSGKTDFGGTDSPLTPSDAEWEDAVARCGGSEPWNLPLVFGPIAVTYNVFGVSRMILDGPTIAKIFTGRIRSWNAPEIAALNPDQPLTQQPIVVIHRGDESGTTDNFQRYLQAAAGTAWDRGAGKVFRGGVGKPRDGNAGAAAAVASTPGSVTYTEWSFAQQQELPAAQIITPAGPDPVALSFESASASLNGVRLRDRGNDLILDISSLYVPTRLGAYPIVLVSYEVVCSRYPDRSTAAAVARFLSIALTSGQDGLGDLGYVPVPAWLRDRLMGAIDQLG